MCSGRMVAPPHMCSGRMVAPPHMCSGARVRGGAPIRRRRPCPLSLSWPEGIRVKESESSTRPAGQDKGAVGRIRRRRRDGDARPPAPTRRGGSGAVGSDSDARDCGNLHPSRSCPSYAPGLQPSESCACPLITRAPAGPRRRCTDSDTLDCVADAVGNPCLRARARVPARARARAYPSRRMAGTR